MLKLSVLQLLQPHPPLTLSFPAFQRRVGSMKPVLAMSHASTPVKRSLWEPDRFPMTTSTNGSVFEAKRGFHRNTKRVEKGIRG